MSGPIRVSPNGRYFTDQNGTPFFWLGDTQWELFREFSLAEAQAILETRKRQGFSVIQVMLTGVGDGTKPNLAGQTPWIDADPATPNDAYFRHVDAVIESGCQNELVLVIGIFHQRQDSRFTLANARTYARWLAQRYRSTPNLIWTLYPKATPEFIPLIRELAEGLQEGDGGTHLITVHPDPAPASSSFIHAEPWLAFNMIQTWNHYELIPKMVAEDYARTPVKPTVMAEGGYEGVESRGLTTPLAIRKQAYWSHLAGGHHSYGHNNNWVSPASWNSWIDSPAVPHLKIYRDSITGLRDWWNWIPDPSIFASGESRDLTLNVAARSARGDWMAAYLSDNTTVSIRLDKITTSRTVAASWVSPTTGVKTPIGKFPNTGRQSFSTPTGWEDALLLLET